MDSNRDLEGMDLGFRAMLEAEFAEAAARPRPAPGSLPLELAREAIAFAGGPKTRLRQVTSIRGTSRSSLRAERFGLVSTHPLRPPSLQHCWSISMVGAS